MSTIPPDQQQGQTAPDFDGKKQSNEKIEVLYPDVILIDDRDNLEKESHFESATDSQGSQTHSQPLSLRFLCFLGLIFCLIFGVGMLLLSILTTVIAIFSLFRNAPLNQSSRDFWKITIHTLIAGIGFTLGLISPGLGLGLIVLYFSLTGQAMGDHLLYKFIKRSFNQF